MKKYRIIEEIKSRCVLVAINHKSYFKSLKSAEKKAQEHAKQWEGSAEQAKRQGDFKRACDCKNTALSVKVIEC